MVYLLHKHRQNCGNVGRWLVGGANGWCLDHSTRVRTRDTVPSSRFQDIHSPLARVCLKAFQSNSFFPSFQRIPELPISPIRWSKGSARVYRLFSRIKGAHDDDDAGEEVDENGRAGLRENPRRNDQRWERRVERRGTRSVAGSKRREQRVHRARLEPTFPAISSIGRTSGTLYRRESASHFAQEGPFSV